MQERALTKATAGLFAALIISCGPAAPPPAPVPAARAIPVRPPEVVTALPLDRIAIVGASVSDGLGGTPFGEAFAAAAPRSAVESAANVMLFRDPIGETRRQVERAMAFRATTIVGLDLMFWQLYGSTDPAWRTQARQAALAELDRARRAGAWIVLGDVPHVVTASELLIPRQAIPTAAEVAAFNAEIAVWGARERVLIVPFASWAEPLANDQDTEISPGERVPAKALVTPDGLHPNALGVWALLDRLDRFIETTLPGTPKDALSFARPTR